MKLVFNQVRVYHTFSLPQLLVQCQIRILQWKVPCQKEVTRIPSGTAGYHRFASAYGARPLGKKQLPLSDNCPVGEVCTHLATCKTYMIDEV